MPQLIETSVDVDLPLRETYAAWRQLELFPGFTQGVESVERLDDRRQHWAANAEIGYFTREWMGEITREEPEELIAWRAIETQRAEVLHEGNVRFEPLDFERTRVSVTILFMPQTLLEMIFADLGFVRRRVAADVRRFKRFHEALAAGERERAVS